MEIINRFSHSDSIWKYDSDDDEDKGEEVVDAPKIMIR